MQRKGSVFDIITAAILVFGVAFVFIFANSFLGEIKQPLKDAGLNESYIEKGETATQSMNIVSLIIFGVSSLGAVASAFFIRAHPIFLPFSLVLGVVAVSMMAIFSNIFAELTSVSFLNMGNFATAELLFNNLPIVGAGFVLLIMLVMFARRQGGGGLA